jgi:acetyltransferase-like isoleucine patch superfamily enzyme
VTSEPVYARNVLELGSEPAGRFVIEGRGCSVRIGANVRLEANVFMEPEVTHATLEVGDDCVIRGVIRFVRGDGGTIRIGPRTTFNQAGLTSHEGGAITFGADCMLSTDVHLDASDMHPIYDRASGQRLNPPQDIEIGDHVWLSTRVLVLKGAKIGSGAIIGAGSMVAGIIPPNTLAVGSPAKVVREDVVWSREFDGPPVVEARGATAPRASWPWRKG